MKNKKKIYILTISTFLIWAVIGYKIVVNLLNKKDDGNNPHLFQPQKKQDNVASDTFSLVNNYSDPFLKNDHRLKAKPTITNRVVRHKPLISPTPSTISPVVWPLIYFNGTIVNIQSHVITANIKINGKERIMKTGDTKDEVKLIRLRSDSAQFSYKSESKWILRQ